MGQDAFALMKAGMVVIEPHGRTSHPLYAEHSRLRAGNLNGSNIRAAGAKTKYERPSSKYPAKRQRTSETGQPSKRVDQLKSQRQVENATDTTARHSSPHAGLQAKSGNNHEDFGPQGSTSTPNDVPKLPARNAFSILSASAEKAFQAHYFYCGLHDGQWRCEIWPVGQANPRLAHDSAAWSAQARVTFKPRSAAAAADEAQAPQSAAPPARQAEVRLRSNVAPGNQGPPQTQDGRRLADGLQQPRPPGESYTGGAPLLKSALQVRPPRMAHPSAPLSGLCLFIHVLAFSIVCGVPRWLTPLES